MFINIVGNEKLMNLMICFMSTRFKYPEMLTCYLFRQSNSLTSVIRTLLYRDKCWRSGFLMFKAAVQTPMILNIDCLQNGKTTINSEAVLVCLKEEIANKTALPIRQCTVSQFVGYKIPRTVFSGSSTHRLLRTCTKLSLNSPTNLRSAEISLIKGNSVGQKYQNAIFSKFSY